MRVEDSGGGGTKWRMYWGMLSWEARDGVKKGGLGSFEAFGEFGGVWGWLEVVWGKR